jgi:hypothetical protein
MPSPLVSRTTPSDKLAIAVRLGNPPGAFGAAA